MKRRVTEQMVDQAKQITRARRVYLRALLTYALDSLCAYSKYIRVVLFFGSSKYFIYTMYCQYTPRFRCLPAEDALEQRWWCSLSVADSDLPMHMHNKLSLDSMASVSNKATNAMSQSHHESAKRTTQCVAALNPSGIVGALARRGKHPTRHVIAFATFERLSTRDATPRPRTPRTAPLSCMYPIHVANSPHSLKPQNVHRSLVKAAMLSAAQVMEPTKLVLLPRYRYQT